MIRTANMLIGQNVLDQTGPATRADGYYGFADGLHTVAFYLKNFRGRLFLEGTLSDDPKETDWFPIVLAGDATYVDIGTAATKIESFNVVGNFVYLRARVQRSHLPGLPSEYGICERVVLSL